MRITKQKNIPIQKTHQRWTTKPSSSSTPIRKVLIHSNGYNLHSSTLLYPISSANITINSFRSFCILLPFLTSFSLPDLPAQLHTEFAHVGPGTLAGMADGPHPLPLVPFLPCLNCWASIPCLPCCCICAGYGCLPAGWLSCDCLETFANDSAQCPPLCAVAVLGMAVGWYHSLSPSHCAR